MNLSRQKKFLARLLRLRYREMPVRHKLLITVLAASAISVVFAGVVLFVIQVRTLRDEFRDHFVALTRVVADQATAPLSFEDYETLNRVLSAFNAKAEVKDARIVLPSGMVVARFGAATNESMYVAPNRSGIVGEGWNLKVSQPLILQERLLAQLMVTASFRPVFFAALSSYILSLVIVLFIALAIATTLTLALSRIFIKDLERLTLTTSQIAETNDFTVRAPASSPDEIGLLTRSFNRMLDRLQADDLRLRAANLSLNKEISERTRVEGQLLEASRLAGMAQVATGVLHNVGNVLNSVNISTQVLRNTLSSHPHLALLDQTTALLRSQGDNLGQFLAEDRRGKLVPRLIIELGTQLAVMRADLLREADQLTQNVEHIKQIIAMQQNYAKAGGVIQRINPAELFAEALRIAQASVSRHGVTLQRDEACVCEMMTDRHQVLQILVNFITNAVQAVKPRSAGDRIVRLGLREVDGSVFFSVEDNGIGISQQNMQKLFQHGFTTRKDGHGFGLHSGALAARNLGGRIDVYSGGPDTGSRFTLQLPLSSLSPAPAESTPAEASHALV